jgi:hypothetical protein
VPRPTRPPSDCGREIQRTNLYPDSFAYLRPTLDTLSLIAQPPPGSTFTVHMRVDESGHVDPYSIRVEGARDSTFIEQLRATVYRYRFTPAVLDGCAVPSTFWIRVSR